MTYPSYQEQPLARSVGAVPVHTEVSVAMLVVSCMGYSSIGQAGSPPSRDLPATSIIVPKIGPESDRMTEAFLAVIDRHFEILVIFGAG